MVPLEREVSWDTQRAWGALIKNLRSDCSEGLLP